MTRKEIESLLLPIHSKLQNIVCELVANGFDGDSFTLHLVGGEVTFLIKKTNNEQTRSKRIAAYYTGICRR